MTINIVLIEETVLPQMNNIQKYDFKISSFSCSNEKETKALFIGKIESNWGFFLVESLSRLWYFIEHPEISRFAYIAPDEANGYDIFGTHTKRILEIFSLLGIQREQLIKISEDEVNDCIIPSESFHHIEIPTYGKKTANAYLKYLGEEVDGVPAYYFTEKYKKIYNTIRDNCICNLPIYDKIYFSRTKLKKKKEIGEKELERIFAANGFKIIYPEQLSPSAQIWYVKNCKVLASVEGTLAHNSLFASEGMKQIILRKQSEIIPRQYMINQSIGIETSYVKCFKEPFKSFPISHSKGPFLLRAGNELDEFCKANNFQFIRSSIISSICFYIEYSAKCLLYYVEKKMKQYIK